MLSMLQRADLVGTAACLVSVNDTRELGAFELRKMQKANRSVVARAELVANPLHHLVVKEADRVRKESSRKEAAMQATTSGTSDEAEESTHACLLPDGTTLTGLCFNIASSTAPINGICDYSDAIEHAVDMGRSILYTHGGKLIISTLAVTKQQFDDFMTIFELICPPQWPDGILTNEYGDAVMRSDGYVRYGLTNLYASAQFTKPVKLTYSVQLN